MMNRRGSVGEGFVAARRISNCFKDRDEELSFFRDLQKRDKDRVASLLDQPVSEEFEPNGNYGLFRMDSGGRRGHGIFIAESGKNDYNWLKTPPATPLFPSLEMEATGQQFITHKEIPIIHQPLSRLAGNSESSNPSTNNNNKNNISSTPNPKPKLPQRHRTPNGRPSVSSLDKKNMKTAPIHVSDKTKAAHVQTSGISPKLKPSTPIVKQPINIITKESNRPKTLSKSMEPTDPNPKHTRGFSNETPPNLRTTSTTRGRPNSHHQKPETNSKFRRQSCSPSGTRGRKAANNDADHGNAAGDAVKGRRQSGHQVLGSRMVDRFMSARTTTCNAGERKGDGIKIKLSGSLNEGSGFGRLMSKSSFDMALKHMEIQRSTIPKHGVVPAKKYT